MRNIRTDDYLYKLLRLPLGLTQEFIVYHPAHFIILHQVIGTVAQLCLQINDAMNADYLVSSPNLHEYKFIG